MTRAQRWLGRIAQGLVALYGLALCLMMIIRVIRGGETNLVATINIAITILLMPSLLLFPMCLILRRWWLSAIVAVPFLAFMVVYLPFFLPRPVTIPADAPHLRLLTYNLHAEQKILDPIVALIRDSKADIVSVQEMSPEASAAFDKQLADVYPYRALYPSPDGFPYHGHGVLSRYPIMESKTWPVEYPIPVRLMWAEINIGFPITVYNFHAPPSVPIYGEKFDIRPRVQQINDLMAIIAQQSGPVLLMGDFNTHDTDVNYPHITAQLQDTYREVGWGMGFTGPDWTYPQSQEGPSFLPPYERIDYIFHNEFFYPVEAHVWPTSGGSDHRPVFAELAICTACFYALK